MKPREPDIQGTAPSPGAVLRPVTLARLAGVSTDTLRHYERKGILPPPRRAENGYREYERQALDRVRLIRRALRLGFTLHELARLLPARDRAVKGRGTPPCREVRDLAAAKLARIEEQLRDLAALRDELCGVLADWDGRIERADDNERAGLLESLPDPPEDGPASGHPLPAARPGIRPVRRKEPGE